MTMLAGMRRLSAVLVVGSALLLAGCPQQQKITIIHLVLGGTGQKTVTIDSQNTVWVDDYATGNLFEVLQGLHAKGAPASFALGRTLTTCQASTNDGTNIVCSGNSSGPTGAAIDANGHLWIANSNTSNVMEVDRNGNQLVTQSIECSPCIHPYLETVGIDPTGNVWVLSVFSPSYNVLPPNNGAVTEFDAHGNQIGTFNVGDVPQSLAIDATGRIWVTNSQDNTVVVLAPNGQPWFGSQTNSSFPAGTNPTGIAVDTNGNVWVTNNNPNGTVTELSSNELTFGQIIKTIPVGQNPQGIAIDTQGFLWVANNGGNTVTAIIPAVAKSATEAADYTQFASATYDVDQGPFSIAIDHTGNVMTTSQTSLTIIDGVSTGQFFPYTGPQFTHSSP